MEIAVNVTDLRAAVVVVPARCQDGAMVTTWPNAAATDLLARLVENLEHELPHAQALRRELHRHPDLSGHERPTVDRLRQVLPTLKPTRVADTGFLVRVGPPGPSVAIRAELDALPLLERTGVEWASGNTRHARLRPRCPHGCRVRVAPGRTPDGTAGRAGRALSAARGDAALGRRGRGVVPAPERARGVRGDRRARAAPSPRRGDQHRSRRGERCRRPVRHRRARPTGARRLPARRHRSRARSSPRSSRACRNSSAAPSTRSTRP